MVAMSSPWKDPRTGIFYIRRAVPADLRDKLGWFYKRSLQTRDPQEAKRFFTIALAKSEKLFAETRRALGEPEKTEMSQEEAERLADIWLATVLEEDEGFRREGGGDADLFLNVKEAVEQAGGVSTFSEAQAVAEYGMSDREIVKDAENIAWSSTALKTALARGDVSLVVDDVEDFIESHGLRLKRESPAFRRLAYAFLKASVKATELIARRQQGEIVETPKVPAVEDFLSDGSDRAGEQGETISIIYESWKTERKPTPKLTADWDKAFRRFVQLHGDLPITAVTRRHVAAFKDALLKMPARPKRAIRELPMPEVIKLVGDNPKVPKLSAGSVKKDLAAVQSVISWAVENGYREDNPASGIKIREAKNKSDERLPYELKDLQRLFASPVFASGFRPRGGAGAAAYWLPILALFTGARLEELGLLRTTDVQQADRIWFLDIHNLDPGKRIKTKSSKRKVPIHPELLRLGFLRYVEKRRELGKDVNLFPDLKPDGKGVVTGNWSKWWGRYARSVGVTDRRKVFHSFRHTFKDACRAAGIEEAIHDALTGHSGGGVGRTYGIGYPLSVLAGAIKKIRYPGVVLARFMS
jgi:integrase